MTCPFCVNGECRSKNEKTCDFKTLAYDKDSIKARIEQEMEIIEGALNKLKATTDKSLVQPIIQDMGDRLIGIKIMQQELVTLGFPYKSERNPFRLMILIKQVDKHLKKMDKDGK